MGIQGVVLEDHRDITIPCRHLIDTVAIDTEVAFGDVFKSGHHPERGAFAAAGWADQHHKLTVFDDEIDIFDGSNAAVIDLANTFEFNACHGLLQSPASSFDRSGSETLR